MRALCVCVYEPNTDKLKQICILYKTLTMARWIRLRLLCRCNWTRKSEVWYGNVSEQYLILCGNKSVYCAWARFLCMHKILVHAQHSCACTTLLCIHWRGQGPRPGPKQKTAGPGRTYSCFLFGSQPWSLAPPMHGPECCACTRVLCMHKNLVHAQESWA